MNDFRNKKDYHNTRPVISREEMLENADLLLEYYNKFKSKYIKLAKKQKGFVSNNMIDSIFNEVMNEKELDINTAHVIDGFFDMVINIMMMFQNSNQTDAYICQLLNKSIHQVVKK